MRRHSNGLMSLSRAMAGLWRDWSWSAYVPIHLAKVWVHRHHKPTKFSRYISHIVILLCVRLFIENYLTHFIESNRQSVQIEMWFENVQFTTSWYSKAWAWVSRRCRGVLSLFVYAIDTLTAMSASIFNCRIALTLVCMNNVSPIWPMWIRFQCWRTVLVLRSGWTSWFCVTWGSWILAWAIWIWNGQKRHMVL